MRTHRITPGDVAHLETREDGKKTIVGYGAVFYDPADPGSEYRMFADTVERIAPTAFNRALEEGQDVRGLLNHDPTMLLGRTAANTMRLSVDARGLRYEIDLPDTTTGRDVAALLERGDLSGSSFSFSPKKRTWANEGKSEVATLTDVDLYDVGPVTFPAYGSTASGMRSDGDVTELETSRAAWRESERVAAQGVVDRDTALGRAKIAGAKYG